MKHRDFNKNLWMVRFTEIMAERRYGNVTVKEIAGILGCSSQYLNTIYHKHSDMNVGQKIKIEREKFKKLGKIKKKRIIKQQKKIFKNVDILYRNF